MIKLFCKKFISKNGDAILEESRHVRGFIRLLMKHRNSRIALTQEEIHDFKSYVKRLSLHMPILIIIVLPLGLGLLPILAEILDRRKKDVFNQLTRRNLTTQGFMSESVFPDRRGCAAFVCLHDDPASTHANFIDVLLQF
jgi:hypothetical protein